MEHFGELLFTKHKHCFIYVPSKWVEHKEHELNVFVGSYNMRRFYFSAYPSKNEEEIVEIGEIYATCLGLVNGESLTWKKISCVPSVECVSVICKNEFISTMHNTREEIEDTLRSYVAVVFPESKLPIFVNDTVIEVFIESISPPSACGILKRDTKLDITFKDTFSESDDVKGPELANHNFSDICGFSQFSLSQYHSLIFVLVLRIIRILKLFINDHLMYWFPVYSPNYQPIVVPDNCLRVYPLNAIVPDQVYNQNCVILSQTLIKDSIDLTLCKEWSPAKVMKLPSPMDKMNTLNSLARQCCVFIYGTMKTDETFSCAYVSDRIRIDLGLELSSKINVSSIEKCKLPSKVLYCMPLSEKCCDLKNKVWTYIDKSDRPVFIGHGSTLNLAEVILIFYFSTGPETFHYFTSSDKNEWILVFKKFNAAILSKYGIIPPLATSTNSIDNIFLPSVLKPPINLISTLNEILSCHIAQHFSTPGKFGSYLRHTLIMGDQGSGKSIILNLVFQKQLQSPYYLYMNSPIQGKELRGKKLDSIQKTLENIFNEAKFRQPAVILIDDLDIIVPNNEENQNPSHVFGVMMKKLLSDPGISLICTATSYLSLPIRLRNGHGNHFFGKIFNLRDFRPKWSLEDIEYFLPTGFNISQLCSGDIKAFCRPCYSPEDVRNIVRLTIHAACIDTSSKDGETTNITPEHLKQAVREYVPRSFFGFQLADPGTVKFSNIGGLTNAKTVLTQTILWPLRRPELFANSPVRLQYGVLLYGLPGVGKTLLAKALAAEANVSFILVKGPELLSKYIGASESGVRDLFKRAYKIQPTIILFDEFDSLGSRRGQDSTGVTDRVVNQLLTELDGIRELSGVYIVATTSRPDMIDPALLRPGRIGVQVRLPLPDQEVRKEIWDTISPQIQLDDDVDIARIMAITEGLTGADIKALLVNAQMVSCQRHYGHIIRSMTLEEAGSGAMMEKLEKPSVNMGDITNALKGMTLMSKRSLDEYNETFNYFESLRNKSISKNVLRHRKAKVTLA